MGSVVRRYATGKPPGARSAAIPVVPTYHSPVSVGDKGDALGRVLARNDFAFVLTSPMLRARVTCELAGLR